MALADQEPVRMFALQLARIVDFGNGNDGRRATRERVRGDRKGTKHIDDDGDALRRLRTGDVIYYRDLQAATSFRPPRSGSAASTAGSLALQANHTPRV